MRNIFVVLLLVLCTKVSSQNIEKTILLKDADTNLPIEDATVYVLKTKQNFISNSDGVVTLLINGTSNIQISHASYSGITIRTTVLKDKENIVFLKSNINNLDEIIITKQHPQKILKTLVDNSIDKLTIPTRLKVYSREFFKLNGTYSNYNDGLINFQLSGTSKKITTNILVEQNRSFGLIDEDIKSDLLGYNLNDIMENYYNFKYLDPILEPKARKEYDFLIKSYPANPDYYVMLVTTLDEAKGLLDDFTIIYDKKKKIIIQVSSLLSPSIVAKNKDKTAIGSKNIYKSLFKTIYKVDNSNYYLISSREEIGFERIDKKKTTNIEVRNYFVTTNFSNQKFSFNESDVFKDKTLFNKKNVILSDYWNTSGLTATDEEQEIVNKIEDNH